MRPNTNTNTIRFQSVAEYEYEYYSGLEIWPNTNTNTIRFQKFGWIRILFGVPLLSEYEYEYLDYSNNTEDKYE